MLPLEGLGVLVTRPRDQALALCRLLEAQGARPLRFPAMEIHPLAEPRGPAEHGAAVAGFDIVVFTSANAVKYGARLLAQTRDHSALPLEPPREQSGPSLEQQRETGAPPLEQQREHGAPPLAANQQIAAIGPATARALAQAGHRVAVEAGDGADSESLLRHPRLGAVAGTRILLVKGNHGRDLLQRELTGRGADVTAVEVYRRACPRPTAAELSDLEAQFAGRAIQIITATSAEIAGNLLALATPALRRQFERAHWLVPGERVARSLQDAGCAAPLVKARSAEDQELVSALVRWRAAESGA
jgi:uroporphyrinogen-III synthase